MVLQTTQGLLGLELELHKSAFDGLRLPKTIPQTHGVYYFLDAQEAILYIGKSIHIRQRLSDHLAKARTHARWSAMIRQTKSIAWRETCGDFHAQLMENRQIKQYMPLYNRAQRRLKRCFTWHINFDCDSSLAITFSLKAFDDQSMTFFHEPCYGVFKSARAAQQALQDLADDEGLCLQVMGLTKGRGRCFRSQVNKCLGACCGYESTQTMVLRCKDALWPWRFEAWPAGGPLVLAEGDCWHVLYQWRSFGVFAQKPTAQKIKQLLKKSKPVFEKDEYRIIRRYIKAHEVCV